MSTRLPLRSLFSKRTAQLITNPRSYSSLYGLLKKYGVKDTITHCLNYLRNGNHVNQGNAGSVRVPSENDVPSDVLSVGTEKNPVVSIIIPVYNNFHLTYNCIKSIIDHRPRTPFEIIVVDDCSTDGTKGISEVIEGIKVIRNEQNLGFLLNCNKAALESQSKYLLFLNNDTCVCDDWLDSLVDTMESDDSIGMSGSKFLYPNGSLQEAGGIIWSDGSALNYGKGCSPFCGEFNYLKDVDYISGASILVRNDLFKEIGGFDERYVPAYCEDSDLAMEIRKRGYRVVYQPKSVIYHFEGMSNGVVVTTGLKQYQVVNNRKLKKKWEKELKSEHCADDRQIFFARDRSLGKKTILLIDDNVPVPDDNAGNRTVFDYIRCLVSMHMNVKLLISKDSNDRYANIIQGMGVEIIFGNETKDRGKSWIKENGKFLDYVFAFRYNIAEFYLDTIRKHSSAVVYYNVADLHFLRKRREYETSGDEGILEESKKLEIVERKIMNQCDRCVTVSSFEYDIISKMIGSEKTLQLPTCCYENCDIGPREQPIEKSLMFVGGFSHDPNVDAVLYFVKDILPIVRSKVPDVKFFIIGSNPTHSIKECESSDIRVCGHISDEELADHYRKHSISVVPLRFGAGVKGKVIDAMYHKIPIVSTSVGLEGIDDLSPMLQPKDSPEEFANEIISLLNDSERSAKMGESYLDCIRKHYSMDTLKEMFSKEFKLGQ